MHLFTHLYLYPSVFAEMIQHVFRVLNVQVVLVPGFRQFPEILMGSNHVCFIFLTLNIYILLVWC